MDIAHPIHTEISSLSFSFLSTDDVRAMSVKQCDNPILLDNLNLPNKGGLYDPKLGPMTSRDVCETCHLSYFACPGHYGHVELPVPVYHPIFMGQAYKLLYATCLYCHHFKMPELVLQQFIARIQLLDAGLIAESHEVATFVPTSRDEEIYEPDEEEMAGGSKKNKKAKPTTIDPETAADFIVKLQKYVKVQLHRAAKKGSGVKDEYKDGLVYTERRALLDDVLRVQQRPWRVKCSRCYAQNPTYRKEKTVKIIELELDVKQKLVNATLGVKRTNMLGGSRSKNKSKANGTVNGDASDSEGSEAGEDNEMEVDESVQDEDEEDEEEEDDIGDAIAKTASGKVKGARARNEKVMSVGEVRSHLRILFNKESELAMLLYGRHGGPTALSRKLSPSKIADMFFMDVIPVTPTRFRPPAKMGDELFENAQNSLLSAVITTSKRITDLTQRLRDNERAEKGEVVFDAIQKTEAMRVFPMLLEALVKLQHDVNSFIDSSKNPNIMRQGKLPPPGVKQLLEKKEGLFRKHMMGKRVNYAARSVISPDINIETNEIGIPPVFAKKLTYPEPVTHHNVAEMRQLVINGPRVHPGASLVQNEDGSQISLDRTTEEQRMAIANQLLTPQTDAYAHTAGSMPRNKKVYRHIRDGDIVILNRQPTLHKPSMMAHKVKVLLGEKTIRMHYANCNSYNADFDGDEMNIHFPQNEVARAEALYIANTDNQYLVPTSGKPLRGLIQDHVVAGVWLCNRSSFFTRDQYFQLIYGALRTENNYSGEGRIITLPPAIFKPVAMWTGKQLLSTILINLTPSNARGLNLVSRNKIQHNLWNRDKFADPAMSEETTIFLDGHLICGVLDKSQYGASDYGLIHSVHELYGPMIANRLLGVLSRLLTKYLQHDAFSCRMDDLILTADGEKLRKDILAQASADGARTAIKYVGLPENSRIEDPETARNLTIRLEETLRSDSLMAGLDSVMQSSFNKTTSKINNEVLPKHLVRPFPDNNMQMMTISGAKGSKVNASQISTLLGQQALEGRRVPTMVSGKTLPSFKPFDTSARAGGYVANRFLTGIRPQEYYFHCMAGREGLIDTAVKTSRSGYLQRCLIKHLEGVKVHYDHTVRDSDSSILQFLYGEDSLDVTRSKHLEAFDFAARNHDSLIQRYNPKPLLEGNAVIRTEAVDHMKKALKKPAKYEPVLSKFSPSRYLGSMSEAYATKIGAYIEDNKMGYLSKKGAIKPSPYASERIPDKEYLNLARARYMRGLVDPGEAVGLLASQGVGEPSTQMTLNTFHLAGHGAANVTLGIPRLREIVMTAAQKPQTPTMKLPLRDTVTDADCESFIKQVSKLTLSEVIERVVVTERLSSRTNTDARLRKYTVLLEFYPAEEYLAEYGLTPDQLHEAVAFNLSWRLKKEILQEMRTAKATLAQDMAVGVGLKVRAGIDEDDDGPLEEYGPRRGRDDELEDDDNDAGQAKRAKQSTQHEYEEDELPEGDIADYEDYVEKHLETVDREDEDGDLDVDPAVKAQRDQQSDILADTFKTASKYATSFSFDLHSGKSAQFDLEFPADAPKLLLVDIVERTCRASVIHEVTNIGRCMKVYDDKGNFTRHLITEGSNLSGMHALADELVDLDRVTSNDIYALLTTYGVEAARKAVIDEVSSVFGAYAIAVDYRHLTIIADYMTHAGGYRPFNRTGISNKSSPLLKASFETTVQFLSEAVLHGDFDDLTSPAAKIVLGKPSTSGTGSFDIRAPAPRMYQQASSPLAGSPLVAAAA